MEVKPLNLRFATIHEARLFRMTLRKNKVEGR